MRFDFHCHSYHSDGTLSPRELVLRAAINGTQALALTDHDTLDGVAEAAAQAKEIGLQFINGVEISVTWEKHTIHILGLGVDAKNIVLLNGLASLRELRIDRAKQIGEALDKAGIKNAFEGALKLCLNPNQISRTHFARYIVEQNYAKNTSDVFKRYLIPNRIGYVETLWASLQQSIECITNAGGIAVIAHPARYGLRYSKLRLLVEEFISYGGRGLEVISNSHTVAQNKLMAKVAQQYNLLASSGSDFHSLDTISWCDIGKNKSIPEDLESIYNTINMQQTSITNCI